MHVNFPVVFVRQWFIVHFLFCLRQLRNRDSAMKSRERRKLYIHDLEKRSRSLEMECRRLEHLLYSAAAENRALHQHLQRDRTIGSSTAKQESAVLFVGKRTINLWFRITSWGYFSLCNHTAWAGSYLKFIANAVCRLFHALVFLRS